MYCPNCGKQVDRSDTFCRSCGRTLLGDKSAPGEAPLTTAAPSSGAKAELPIRRSGEATASLILGLFSFIPVLGLLAVIFGHLARATIRRSAGRLLGDGMAVVGLLFGYLGMLGWLVYGASIVIHPLLPSTLREQNRHIVVGSLRVINTAAITYVSTYNQGFPPSLAALGPPPGKVDYKIDDLSEKAAGLIDEVLASGTKSEFRFTYVAGKKVQVYYDTPARIDTYTVRADPVDPDETVHYFTDESAVIRMEFGKEVSAESMPIRESSPE